ILPAKNDLPQSGPLSGQHFFLDAAYGQYLTSQRYLSRHSQIGFDLFAGDGAGYGAHHSDTRTGAILWHGALGHMDMDGLFCKELRVYIVLAGIGLEIS